jgi:hypothetical protein
MLVQRWAILRTVMPKGISIKKTIALVTALAKLHNFCTDEMDDQMIESLPNDVYDIMNNEDGYVPLDTEEDHEVAIPRGLLDGGNHFADIPRDLRRRGDLRSTAEVLPRKILHDKVLASHKVRPSTNQR